MFNQPRYESHDSISALTVAVMALAIALPTALLSPAPAAAQSVGQILEEAYERMEGRLAGVDDLAIEQEVMGFRTTTYLAKEIVDGRLQLRVHSVDAGPVGGVSPADAAGQMWSEFGQMYLEFADRWTLEGSGAVDGQATHRLRIDDLEGLDLPETVPGEEMEMAYERILMELEVDRLVPLRITVDGEITEAGATRPVSLVMKLSDYREVQGYLHPFLMAVETDMASIGVSAENVADAQQGIEEMRRQLEQVPDAQRQMIEQMLGPQLAAFEEMVQGDRLTIEMRVTDLRVNAGLP